MAKTIAGKSPLTQVMQQTSGEAGRSGRGGGTPWDKDNIVWIAPLAVAALLLYFLMRRSK